MDILLTLNLVNKMLVYCMIENSLISGMNGFGFSGFGRIAPFSGQTALA